MTAPAKALTIAGFLECPVAPLQTSPFVNIVLSAMLLFLIGWFLYLGRPILLPIVAAVIAVYLLISASDRLKSLPVLRHLPLVIIRSFLLIVFTLAIVVLATIVAATAREIVAVVPVYEANVDALVDHLADVFDLDRQELWDELRAVTIDQIDLRSAALRVLSGFTNVGMSIFVIVIYAAFIMLERDGFERKLRAIWADEARARATLQTVNEINRKISDYLEVKTLINIILGAICYVILWFMDVDFALFWAVAIGFLNYIPYFGSLLGVAFPAVLSVAQFGSLSYSLLLTVLLVIAQFVVGSIIEPRMVGRHMNISPVIVLISLSIWTALWGIPGAILAIPLTSMLAIIFANISQTRPIALVLADRIDETELVSVKPASGR